ncbi:kinesin-like protein KIF20B [Nematostella vectensis]|uniref:kinesin-like protein KIF20B n=1 Tax=Nematostella vectensis TaxID=45351 RepID=UPI002076E2F1|nr:kinesin-like protein KIF20B [Nematostella vectensis]
MSHRNPVYRGGSMKNLSSKDKDIILRQKTEELDEAMQEMKRLEAQVKTLKEENNNKKQRVEQVNKSISENRKLMEELFKEQEEREKLMEERENWMCSYIAGLTVSELVNKTVTMCDTCEADRSNDDLRLKKKKLEIELAEQKEILNNMKKTEADLDREIELLKQELEEAKTKPATAETACQASVEVSNSEVQTICASRNECQTQTEVTNTIKVTQETQTDPLSKVSA